MAIVRLGVARPAANTDATLVSFTENYLVSVIATNVAPTSTPVCKSTIFIVPANATLVSQNAYMAYNVTIPLGSSFETFRFATNPGDTLIVRSTTENISYSCNGILQDDVVGNGDLPQVFNNKVIRGTTNTLYVDKGTTSERSASAEVGYVRFNTEFDTLEVRTTAGWRRVTVVE